MKIGTVHCVDSCQDAPFVIAAGGDNPSDNIKVLDIRENAAGQYLIPVCIYRQISRQFLALNKVICGKKLH